MTVDAHHRYARQIRLREVGAEGQAAIQAASAEVRAEMTADSRADEGGAAHVEAEYLQRAGVGRLIRANGAPVPFAHEHRFRHAQSRQLAAGAWRALHQLRAILALE